MNVTITGRKCTVKDSFRERAEKKLAKIERFFGEDTVANVKVTVEKAYQVVEITVRYGGMIFRAEESAKDMIDALDDCVDSLIRQIRKNKTRVSKKIHAFSLSDLMMEEGETETDFQVVRTKQVSLKPQTVEEAILQMNLLGHQFYMFVNEQTDLVSVVYCRKGGGFGLLEPEDA